MPLFSFTHRLWVLLIANLLTLNTLKADITVSEELNSDVPALQRANIYHSDITLNDYWVSEKLDGVRAYWNGVQFMSKQGQVYHAPVWFIVDFPNFALDGELWLGRGQFDRLSGIVRKHTPIDKEWRDVSYQVFDLPENNQDFDIRLKRLKAYFNRENLPTWLRLLEQSKVKNEQALLSKLTHIESLKGEGLMLHKGSSFYHASRSDDLLKLKTYQDAEAIVISYTQGKGKYQGLVGALVVEAVNHAQKGRKFKIGSGLTDKDRKTPPNIGSLITYKYFGLTSKGLPRFASFMRIRDVDN